MINQPKKEFTEEEALSIAKKLAIDWAKVDYKIEDFLAGMNIELEHGLVNLITNITNDNPLTTGKIVLAHLHESGDYYKELIKMERHLEFKEEMKEESTADIKAVAANKLRTKRDKEVPCDIY